MNTTKVLERILIHEDQAEIMKNLNYLDLYILPQCSAIKKAFDSLNLAEISDNYLYDILFNNSRKIEEDLLTKVSSEVPNQYLQDEALKKAIVTVEKLKKAADLLIKECRIYSCQELLNYLSVSENQNIIFTAKAKEDLKEASRIYVTTKLGIQRRLLHQEAAKALQEFKDSMGTNSINLDPLEMFDLDEENNIILVPVIYE